VSAEDKENPLTACFSQLLYSILQAFARKSLTDFPTFCRYLIAVCCTFERLTRLNAHQRRIRLRLRRIRRKSSSAHFEPKQSQNTTQGNQGAKFSCWDKKNAYLNRSQIHRSTDNQRIVWEIKPLPIYGLQERVSIGFVLDSLQDF